MNQIKSNHIINKVVKNKDYSENNDSNHCFTCNKKFSFLGKIFGRKNIEDFSLCSGCYKLVDIEIEKAKQREIEVRKEKLRQFEEKQKAKGLIKFKDKWIKPKIAKDWKETEIGLKNDFKNVSPLGFEKLTAKLFRNKGYKTKLTKGGGDFGTDVVARKGEDRIAIQCKKYKRGNKVGSKDVQKALGSMWKYDANKAIIITSSNFTKPAIEQARKAPIELWDSRKLKEEIRKHIIDKEYKQEENKTYKDFVRENKDLLKQENGMALISQKWQEYKKQGEISDFEF